MLGVFQQKCLRRILNIRWEDHVKNEEVRKTAGMEPLSCDVKETMENVWPHTETG